MKFIYHLFVMSRPADPQRRTAILNAARAVFAEKGFAGTRVADIAARAGIAPGTVYLYFASKEAMVVALANGYFEELGRVALAAMRHPEPAEAIARTVHEVLALVQRERDLAHLAHLDLGLNGSPLPARQALHDGMAQVLQSRMESGQLHHFDARTLTELITAMMERITETRLLSPGVSLELYESVLVDFLRHALLVPEKIDRKA